MPGDQAFPLIYYLVTSALLAALLVFPISRIIWVMSVRRLQRKRGAEMPEGERRGQRARAYFLAIVLVVPFALLFNYQLLR